MQRSVLYLLSSAIRDYQLVKRDFSCDKQKKDLARKKMRSQIKAIIESCDPAELTALLKSQPFINENLRAAMHALDDISIMHLLASYYDLGQTFRQMLVAKDKEWIFTAIFDYSNTDDADKKKFIRSEIVDVAEFRQLERLLRLANLENAEGNTPLQCACELGDIELVDTMIDAFGCDEDDLGHCNKDKENLLHSIIRSQCDPQKQEIIFKKILLLLQENDKDTRLLQQKDVMGQTPFELATLLKKSHLVALMRPDTERNINLHHNEEKNAADSFPERAKKFHELHEFFTGKKASGLFVFLKLPHFIDLMRRIKQNEPLELYGPIRRVNLWTGPPIRDFRDMLNTLIRARPSQDELNQYLNFLMNVSPEASSAWYARKMLGEVLIHLPDFSSAFTLPSLR